VAVLNKKLHCPSCGGFLLKVERIVWQQIHCTRCHQDVEFLRAPIAGETTIAGRTMKPRMVISFPDEIDELPSR
jgi:hypothetical protein